MPIEPGHSLLHYRLVEQIGEGGMGVVWRAEDTSLGREVAIKVLPEEFSADPHRLGRLEREAKTLASLNHPNIAAVYGFHEHDGVQFIVMELVEGPDLAEQLKAGPLPLDEALRTAMRIAEALEAAHEQGVIHRDLKPANIKLTADGGVKVLDFGLAKAFEPEASSLSNSASLSPTVTSATMAGVLLGTAAYMSPEQARGRPVDRRADIFAFGAVLFEMLTGRRLFTGETVSDTLASVLKTDPEWGELPGETPRRVERLMRRCLDKDVAARLPHVSAARFELRDVLDGPRDPVASGTEAAPAPPSRLRLVPWALVLVLAAAVVALLAVGRGSTEQGPLHLAAPFPDELSLPVVQMGIMAISPDGQRLALVLNDGEISRLYIKRMDAPDFIVLNGTEDANSPFFSPDGRWVGFFADNKVKKILVEGGSPVTLCPAVGQNRGGSWTDDDTIVFSSHYTEPLSRVAGAGGEPEPLTTLDRDAGERTHRWPQAVPGTDLVLFTVGTLDSPESYDDSRIDAVDRKTGERHTVMQGASLARYLPTGHLVYARDGFLFAVPFDLDALEVRGTPVPVAENVLGEHGSGVVRAAIAENGTLAYITGGPRQARRVLSWYHRDGTRERLPAPVNGYSNPTLSPDGRHVAVLVAGAAMFDLWTYDIERDVLTRLTFEGDTRSSAWSPDGKRIAFGASRDDRSQSTYIVRADGSGEAELIYGADRRPDLGSAIPVGWSPDGRNLLIVTQDENAANIIVFSPEDDLETSFAETSFAEFLPEFSPDGRWIAYSSNESGQAEVYVRPFPGPGGRWQISTGGGLEPRWTKGGRELVFRSGGSIMAVDIEAGDGFRAGRPREILDTGQNQATITFQTFAVTADGQRFLLVEPAEEDSGVHHVSMVVNWFDELREKVEP